MRKGERVPDDFHDRLARLVGEVHARDMAYVDLEKCENVLVGEDGRPYLFDMLLPPGIPTLRDLARRRFRADWMALIDSLVAARAQAPAGEAPRDLFDMLQAARDPETGAAFSRTQPARYSHVAGCCLKRITAVGDTSL